MKRMEDIHLKFGEIFNMSQSLEDEILNLSMSRDLIGLDLFEEMKKRAKKVDGCTLRALINIMIKNKKIHVDDFKKIDTARMVCKQLSRGFYRNNKAAHFTDSGRQKMLEDLEEAYEKVFDGYAFVMSLSNRKVSLMRK